MARKRGHNLFRNYVHYDVVGAMTLVNVFDHL